MASQPPPLAESGAAFQHSMDVLAPLPAVWEALTRTGSPLPHFFGLVGEGSFLPGEKVVWRREDTDEVLFEATIRSVSPPRELSFDLAYVPAGEPAARASLRIVPIFDETRVVLNQRGFTGTTPQYHAMSHAWPYVLNALKMVLEEGVPPGPSPSYLLLSAFAESLLEAETVARKRRAAAVPPPPPPPSRPPHSGPPPGPPPSTPPPTSPPPGSTK